jgi:hypothetical protein
MTAEIRSIAPHNEKPLAKATRLRDEARTAALELAEGLTREAAKLGDQCAEAAKLDTLPGGLRDALLKLAMELASRQTILTQIMGPTR